MTGPSKNKKANNPHKRKGYEDIDTCDFCLSDVFYSHEFHAWLEPRTNYHHTKRRCQQILERKKAEQQNRNSKTLRPDVVDDLKQFIDKLPSGTEITKILYFILKKRTTDLDKVTSRELAAAIYPRDVYVTECGDKEPTHDAIERIRHGLTRLRKLQINNTTVVYSKRWENGQWYYFNIQNSKQFEPVKERQIKLMKGIAEGLQKAEDILASGTKERTAQEKIMDKYFEVDEAAEGSKKGKEDSKKKNKKNDEGDNK